MCSIGEDDFGDEGGLHMMPVEPTEAETSNTDPQIVCNKCGQTNADYKLKYRPAECRDCFLNYVRHKFRATLGASKALPRNANVLVTFDGSAESLVLLDMLQHAQTLNTHKRLHCNITILFIDDYQLVQQATKSSTAQYAHLVDVHKLLERFNEFKSYIVSISCKEQVEPFTFEHINTYMAKSKIQDSAFLDQIAHIKTLTKRQDYIKRYRSHLIGHVASHFNCQFAFVSDISSTLSAQLLAAIALGRGSSAALDVALIDDRLANGVKLLRPLKELNTGEVELYLRARQLEPLTLTQYGQACGSRASLPNLLETFVHKLQQNYPATISTISRVGDKLAPNRVGNLENQMNGIYINNDYNKDCATKIICGFCNSPLDIHNSSPLLMTEYSRLVSATCGIVNETSELHMKAQENMLSGDNEKVRHFCYSCRKIQNDCKDKNSLFH